MQDDGQQQQAADTRAATQRRWWLGGLVALVVLVVVTVAVFASGGDGDDDGSASSGSGVGTTAVPTATTVGGIDGTTAATGDTTSVTTPVSSEDLGTSVPGSSASSIATDPTAPTVTVPFVPGNGDTVPVQTVVTAPPVAIDDVADPGTGMSFRLERLEAVQGEANGPGEIAGPAVRVTVVAVNDTGAPVLLETIVVDLQFGSDGSSAAPLSGPGALRFTGELAQGATATGVYVFDVPLDRRDEVSIIVSYEASVSPVVFTGPAPTE